MNDENLYVPYIVYEGELARQERHIKKLLLILSIILVLFFASNMAWLYVWNQYEYAEETTIEATQDGESVNIVGGKDVTYGSDGNNNKETKETKEKEK